MTLCDLCCISLNSSKSYAFVSNYVLCLQDSVVEMILIWTKLADFFIANILCTFSHVFHIFKTVIERTPQLTDSLLQFVKTYRLYIRKCLWLFQSLFRFTLYSLTFLFKGKTENLYRNDTWKLQLIVTAK